VIVLISGSRECPTSVRAYCRTIVRWLGNRRHKIICGDAPGVDSFAYHAAWEFECLRGVYVPARKTPRCNPDQYKIVYVRGGGYAHRDRVMVRQADLVFCFWNGYSRGTKAVWDYALELDKPSRLTNVLTWEQIYHQEIFVSEVLPL
jgi:predicted Rossmann-fold nucleotide-binding protein